MVTKQLRCSGVMEAVRVIAAGSLRRRGGREMRKGREGGEGLLLYRDSHAARAGYPDRVPHYEILGRCLIQQPSDLTVPSEPRAII